MENATPTEIADAPTEQVKPVNWYSGWRLLVTATVTVIGAKLIGIVGLLFAVPIFLWLQPKRGAWMALAVAVGAGIIVAVLYSAVILPAFNNKHDAIQTQPAEAEWWKKGATPLN